MRHAADDRLDAFRSGDNADILHCTINVKLIPQCKCRTATRSPILGHARVLTVWKLHLHIVVGCTGDTTVDPEGGGKCACAGAIGGYVRCNWTCLASRPACATPSG